MANTATISTTETTTPEVAKTGMRGFRSSADIENFYRFVHENRLRVEAKMILETIYKAMGGGKKKKAKKAKGKRKPKKILQ